MFYFAWTILYFAVLLYFLYICFHATKLIRNKLGVFAAVFFVFCIFAFNCNQGKNNNNDDQSARWHSNNDSGIVSMSTVNITIEKSLLYTISIGVVCGNRADSKVPIPLEAYPMVSGTFIGKDWKAHYISIYPTGNPSRYKFQVNGIIEWKILNIVLSIQGKNYTGFFDLK